MLISNTLASDMANEFGTLIDAGGSAGSLKFFTGSAPTHTTDADTGTLLAHLVFSRPSFGAASSGVATANAITSDTSTPATGTAGYWRAYDSTAVVIAQGTVGTSGADINFNTLSWTAGGIVAVSSMTFTQPAS